MKRYKKYKKKQNDIQHNKKKQSINELNRNSNNKSKKVLQPRSWWHIRDNFVSRHGALIVGEDNTTPQGKYHYMDITTNPSENELYISLKKPINNKDKKSHVRKYVGSLNKKRFSKWLMKYEIDERDLDEIEKYLNNKR